ncbi:unnamed protein product [Ectocarpus sp. 12 AP-2014]
MFFFMEGDAGSGSARPDEWGSAVANGDAAKLAELVLLWSGSISERALSILESCVSLLEEVLEEVEPVGPTPSPLPPPPTDRDAWGSAVASGDATELAELVLLWCGALPHPALSILRGCVAVLEKEVALAAHASSPLPSPQTSRGPNRNSCLNALTVALNETCDGKSWYTSTKELQLTSLEFCMACRNHQTLHLSVDAQTPRRLLAAADAPPTHQTGLAYTRVPRLRARCVTWDIATAAELRIPIFAMTGVDCLEFGNAFGGSLEAVAWPRRLKRIEFCYSSPFNRPIDQVEWPESLQTLLFGLSFNQPIKAVRWPVCLQRLVLGTSFDQPIDGVEWPASLQELTFGFAFDQPIEEVSWPESLRELNFGFRFNQPLEGAVWPGSLKKLDLGDKFDQPIAQVEWPDSLKKLRIGHYFNQPVGETSWPDSLQTLSFGNNFNQPIKHVRWPDSLQTLSFGECFNQPIKQVSWPASLRELTVGRNFNQNTAGARWPPGLVRRGAL